MNNSAVNASDKPKQARSCIACGKVTEKRNLLRIVRTSDGKAVYDATGHANGRGAYICKSAECIEKACKKNLFLKHLKVEHDAKLVETLKEVCG